MDDKPSLQEALYPKLDTPAPPSEKQSKGGVQSKAPGQSILGLICSSVVTLTVVVVGVMILNEDPECDTGLVLWTQVFLCAQVGIIVVQTLMLCRIPLKGLFACFGVLFGLTGGVLMVIGIFPVANSKECHEGLWWYVFILEMLFYGIIALVCLVCSVACCVGFRLASLVEEAAQEEEEKQRLAKSGN